MPHDLNLKLLLGLLLLASCLSVRAWTRVPDLQREPSEAHQDANQWEEAVLQLDGRTGRGVHSDFRIHQ
ncbi:unnamed protein product [Ectocarpus sp. CCAP 1310/34]|nr:unnamed protein product [Ectocarpus sp. CCAP 1310/34]